MENTEFDEVAHPLVRVVQQTPLSLPILTDTSHYYQEQIRNPLLGVPG